MATTEGRRHALFWAAESRPPLFLCQRCCSTSPKMRRFKPWYWVTDAACSMFALQTSIGSMLSTHFALWYHIESVLVSMDSNDHQSRLCRSSVAFGFWPKAIQFHAWRRFKMVSKSVLDGFKINSALPKWSSTPKLRPRTSPHRPFWSQNGTQIGSGRPSKSIQKRLRNRFRNKPRF